MKVKELIEMLQDENPDANVFLATQPNYPFENDVRAVVPRHLFTENLLTLDDGCSGDDVFILEGRQLRYMSGDPWSCELGGL